MPLFNCEKCGVVENTALGLYWTANHPEIYDWSDVGKEFKGKHLCSECAPKNFSDGTLTGKGVWHGRFEKSYEKVRSQFNLWKKKKISQAKFLYVNRVALMVSVEL